ncbi:hypothetical protein DV736_g3496, partial [Chaetothyriales sp. CBS 134916]
MPISHNSSSAEEAILNKSNHVNIAEGTRHKESDTLNKRDFATMQGDPLFKKPRSETPEADAVAEVMPEKAAPYLFGTTEGIKIYSNPTTTTTSALKPAASGPSLPAAHYDDDDSDDSEIPTLDMTMVIGFAEEEEGREE